MKIKAYLKKRLTYRQEVMLRHLYYYVTFLIHRNDLTKIAKIYGTDKWGGHRYTPHYAEHLKVFRLKKVKLLEIGVGGYEDPEKGGESLRMWKRYFPFGRIFAIDVYDKSKLQERRVQIFKGSQVDRDFIMDVIRRTGNLDIIVDDGSHINEHVINTFTILFPFLNDGGIYVVEDTQTSYWKDFGGDSWDLNRSGTTMGFFKSLVDGLNHREFIRPGYAPSYFDLNIISIHFYHNLVFIRKGRNDQPSNVVIDNREHKPVILVNDRHDSPA